MSRCCSKSIKEHIFNFTVNLKETDQVLDLCVDGRRAIRETRCGYEHRSDVFVISSSYSRVYEDKI